MRNAFSVGVCLGAAALAAAITFNDRVLSQQNGEELSARAEAAAAGTADATATATAISITDAATGFDGASNGYAEEYCADQSGLSHTTVSPDIPRKDCSYDSAVARLKERGFAAARSDDFNDTVPVDRVIGTDPQGGKKAPEGSAITVHVSKGPDLVLIPDFKGKTITESTDLSAAAGVEIQASGVIGKGRRVRAQAPEPGGKVKRGTVVTIFF